MLMSSVELVQFKRKVTPFFLSVNYWYLLLTQLLYVSGKHYVCTVYGSNKAQSHFYTLAPCFSCEVKRFPNSEFRVEGKGYGEGLHNPQNKDYLGPHLKQRCNTFPSLHCKCN